MRRGQYDVAPPSARDSADAPPPSAHGAAASAATATAATTAVARSRAAGTKTGDASAELATYAYFGSVETSLSHFVSRRVRSADEPYLPKS